MFPLSKHSLNKKISCLLVKIGKEYVAMDLNNSFDASHRFWHLNNGHCFVLKYPTGSQGCEDLWIMKDFRDCVLHLCSFSRKSRNHFYTIKMFIQTQNIWGPSIFVFIFVFAFARICLSLMIFGWDPVSNGMCVRKISSEHLYASHLAADADAK